MEIEIKFRGRSTEDGTLQYGDLARRDDQYAIVTDGHATYINVDPQTISMFIGHTDKNGREIYGRDFIEDDSGRVMLVVWDQKFCSFALDSKGWAYRHFFGEAVFPTDVEIIGNLDDNPELLQSA